MPTLPAPPLLLLLTPLLVVLLLVSTIPKAITSRQWRLWLNSAASVHVLLLPDASCS